VADKPVNTFLGLGCGTERDNGIENWSAGVRYKSNFAFCLYWYLLQQARTSRPYAQSQMRIIMIELLAKERNQTLTATQDIRMKDVAQTLTLYIKIAAQPA
jgi:hypothetical protein